MDIPDMLLPLLKGPVFDSDAKEVMERPYAKDVLKALIQEVEKQGELNTETYHKVMARLKEATGQTGKQLFMSIRAALTGKLKGIELEKIFVLLGKNEILERIRKCLK